MQIEITGSSSPGTSATRGPTENSERRRRRDVEPAPLPCRTPVVATLRSKDVIHSFFLPEFRVKQDAVPGMSTSIWFDAMRVGHWEIACAELCGLGHYRMKGFVTVETPEEFEKWIEEQAAQATPAAEQAGRRPPPPRPRRRRPHEHDHTGRPRLPRAGARGRAGAPPGVHPAPTSFWRKYIFSLDHKVIGKQYMLYALTMLVIGGLLAVLVRWQLAWPGKPIVFMGKLFPEGMPNGQMLPEFYNSLFTMHATIMIFFAIMPILIGAFGNFVVPIQIGARDMAFPTLNMLSFWTAVPAAVVIIWSFFVTGGAAQSGWTSYVPLAIVQTRGQTLWAARAADPGSLFAPDLGELHHDDHQHAGARHDVLPAAADGLGALHHGDPATARAARSSPARSS